MRNLPWRGGTGRVFNVGSQELIIVLFVVLMLFGSKRIPEVARSFGKGVKDFRRAMAGLENELKIDLDLEEKPSRPGPKLGAPEGTAPVTPRSGADAVPPDLTSPLDSSGSVESDGGTPSSQDSAATTSSVPTWKATESSRLPTQPKKPHPLPTQPTQPSQPHPSPTQPKKASSAEADPS